MRLCANSLVVPLLFLLSTWPIMKTTGCSSCLSSSAAICLLAMPGGIPVLGCYADPLPLSLKQEFVSVSTSQVVFLADPQSLPNLYPS